MKKDKFPFFKEEQINDLIGNIISLALYDLCEEPKNPCGAPPGTKYPERWALEHNRQLIINQASAKWFFEKSKLFGLTGLDFKILVKEYKKNATDQQITRYIRPYKKKEQQNERCRNKRADNDNC